MSCQFELTVICDNYAEEGLLSEHGLSFALRADGKNILFDTGNGETLIHNATKLGIDLADISHLVLSHGHYDHTGGIGELLHHNQHCQIIAHPFVLTERYSLHPDKPSRRISMPSKVLSALQQTSASRLQFHVTPFRLSEKIGITGPEAVTSLGAMLQVQMKTVGSPDEAANNLKNWFSKIGAEDTKKN